MAAKRTMENTFPFSCFGRENTNAHQKIWLQSGRDTGYGPQGRWCSPERRVYVDFERAKWLDPLSHAVLDLMERELGGYPDRYDPLGFLVIATADEKSSTMTGGNAHVNKAKSGDEEGLCVQMEVPYFNAGLPAVFGREFKPPIKAVQKFNWSVLNDEDFERLIFRLFFEMNDEFDNVQWLQKTKSPDSGRDISAERKSNGNRVMIQCRHQKSSLDAMDVQTLVTKAETWNPAFQEVFVVTTSAFTQEAVRWVENHNANPGVRPIVKLESGGHVEVMITKYPSLIAHMGIR